MNVVGLGRDGLGLNMKKVAAHRSDTGPPPQERGHLEKEEIVRKSKGGRRKNSSSFALRLGTCSTHKFRSCRIHKHNTVRLLLSKTLWAAAGFGAIITTI